MPRKTSPKISFTARIERFNTKGEKTGWTYVEIPAELAEKLKPGDRRSFRVKGYLDKLAIKSINLLPMGEGNFILTLNAALRKKIGKKHGAMVQVTLEEDKTEYVMNAAFVECLADDPAAETFFKQLSGSHRRYFSKWIDEAKTEATRIKRIALAVNALSRKLGFGEMLRNDKEERRQLGR